MIWRLLVNYSWFLAQLECCARRVLRPNRASSAWQMDVEQHAILLIAQELQKMRDLGIDAALADRHFTGWIATLARRDCRQALRRLQRIHGYNWELPDYPPAIDHRVRREDRVNLKLALAIFDAQERRVVTL